MKAWKNGDADKMLSCGTPSAAERNRSYTYETVGNCRLISYRIVSEDIRGDEAWIRTDITIEEKGKTETLNITYRLELNDGRWLICN